MDLPRSVTTHQRPVLARRPLIEVGDLGPLRRGPRAPAGVEVMLRWLLRCQGDQVGYLLTKLNGRQALGRLKHAGGLICQLGRPWRGYLDHTDRDGSGIEDEVDVLIQTVDHHAPRAWSQRQRRRSHLGGYAGVYVGGIYKGALVGPCKHL